MALVQSEDDDRVRRAEGSEDVKEELPIGKQAFLKCQKDQHMELANLEFSI